MKIINKPICPPIEELPCLSGVPYGECFRIHPNTEVTELMNAQMRMQPRTMGMGASKTTVKVALNPTGLFMRLQTSQSQVKIEKRDKWHSAKWPKRDCNQCKALDMETGEIYLLPPFTKIERVNAVVCVEEVK